VLPFFFFFFLNEREILSEKKACYVKKVALCNERYKRNYDIQVIKHLETRKKNISLMVIIFSRICIQKDTRNNNMLDFLDNNVLSITFVIRPFINIITYRII